LAGAEAVEDLEAVVAAPVAGWAAVDSRAARGRVMEAVECLEVDRAATLAAACRAVGQVATSLAACQQIALAILAVATSILPAASIMVRAACRDPAVGTLAREEEVLAIEVRLAKAECAISIHNPAEINSVVFWACPPMKECMA
jgi:hypothetical protein